MWVRLFWVQWGNSAEIRMLFKNQQPIGTCLQALGVYRAKWWSILAVPKILLWWHRKENFFQSSYATRENTMHPLCASWGCLWTHYFYIFLCCKLQHWRPTLFQVNTLLFLCKNMPQRAQVIISLFIFLVKVDIFILMVHYIVIWICHKSF